MPFYQLWNVPELRKECARLAGDDAKRGQRQGLRFGSSDTDVLRQISAAKKDEMVNALVKRADWREEYGGEPEWTRTPMGVTPEKKKREHERRVHNAERGCGRVGDGGSSTHEGYLCRVVCLTLSPPLWDLYHQSKGKISRAEQDAKETGFKDEFYVKSAQAMVNVDWEDSNGNKVSVPSDHSKDDRAPDGLRRQLRAVDLAGAARGLLNERRLQWPNNEEAFLFDLQKRCYAWLKEARSTHTEFLSKQTISGGDGADAGEDGDPTNAIHPFEFMSGSLPTMLWEDGIALLGGDENGGGGDAIIPDSQPGSGSSVPGGPGVLSIQERAGTGIKPPPKVKKERKGRQAKKGQEDFGEVRAGAERIVAKASQAIDHELRRGATEVGDEKMLGIAH
ncbi:unnamed protein product [Pylaiella littoralis]